MSDVGRKAECSLRGLPLMTHLRHCTFKACLKSLKCFKRGLVWGVHMPMSFNTYLEQAGLNLDDGFLLRHEDPTRLPPGRIYSAWLNERTNFEAYQNVQKWNNRFREGSWLASFVVAPTGETLFVGIYHVKRTSPAPVTGPYDDPLLGKMPPEDRAWHETQHSDRMQEYEGKLVIDWGPGTRQWRQLARNHNKIVLEQRRRFREEQFPGYANFRHRLGELKNIYPSWRMPLEAARGIYLLVFDDGMQYVGSASGERGFLQRWENYLANGHGGNKVLIGDCRDARNAMVSIYETRGSGETRNDIVKREMFIQAMLGSRAKALDDLDE